MSGILSQHKPSTPGSSFLSYQYWESVSARLNRPSTARGNGVSHGNDSAYAANARPGNRQSSARARGCCRRARSRRRPGSRAPRDSMVRPYHHGSEAPPSGAPATGSRPGAGRRKAASVSTARGLAPLLPARKPSRRARAATARSDRRPERRFGNTRHVVHRRRGEPRFGVLLHGLEHDGAAHGGDELVCTRELQRRIALPLAG